MKTALLTLLLTMTSTFAAGDRPGVIRLIENDIAIEPITQAEVVHQEMMCEDNTCFVNGTRVHIKLTLGGCLDRLGPVSYTASQKGGHIKLNVSAYNIANSDSFAAFCFAMPEEVVEIDLINMYGKVDLTMIRPIARLGQ
jgi:hypothetical protein